VPGGRSRAWKDRATLRKGHPPSEVWLQGEGKRRRGLGVKAAGGKGLADPQTERGAERRITISLVRHGGARTIEGLTVGKLR